MTAAAAAAAARFCVLKSWRRFAISRRARAARAPVCSRVAAATRCPHLADKVGEVGEEGDERMGSSACTRCHSSRVAAALRRAAKRRAYDCATTTLRMRRA